MKITLMMAVTADGKIAKNSNHFPDWTSKEDKKYFLKISKQYGVIMMGDKTFHTLPGPLPGRLNVVFTLDKNPPKINGVKWVSGEPLKVIKELQEQGYGRALLGGGAFLNSQFMEKKLIDEMILTIEPVIFGQGLSLFAKDFNVSLELLEIKKLNKNSFAVKYKVL